jgi:enediyne biosynthesis protein E4
MAFFISIPSFVYSINSVQLINAKDDYSNLNDPAPAKNKARLYQSIKSEFYPNSNQSQKSHTEYIVESRSPGEITGQLQIQLSKEYFAETVNPTIKVLAENSRGDFSAIVEQEITHHSIDVTIPGSNSRRFKIVLSNVSNLKSPIQSIGLNGIVLSDRKRIMLIGDSITKGKYAADSSGYRKYLYDELIANQYDVEFVGDFGPKPYWAHYQGGTRISAFYPFSLGGSASVDVTGPLSDEQPNIVAIHLGTNDINNDAPAGPYENGGAFTNTIGGNIATLVNYILGWNNGEKGTSVEQIIVSLLIPAKYLDSTVYAANKEIAQVVHHFQNGTITGSPEPVVLCDHFTPFYEYPGFLASYYKKLLADKLHPNDEGHQLMAKTYLKTITDLLDAKQYWFEDKSWELGITGLDAHFGYQGVSAVDVNNDDQDDLYFAKATSDAPEGGEEYYENSAELPFVEKGAVVGLDDPGLSRNGVFVDIENDGDYDVFVSDFETRNKLYENLGNDLFRDITAEAGIADLQKLTTGVIAFDCENDGDMDLFAINSRTVNEFYINNGFGKFQKEDRGLDGVEEPNIASSTASAADFDNDGDIDVYVVKRGAPNILYVNDGNGYFSDQAETAGVAVNDQCNGAFWADLDNDANLDLVLSLAGDESAPFLFVFRNNGNGTFQDKTTSVNIKMDGYSTVIADFDNDGFLDIVTTNETTLGEFYQNNGNWDFTLVGETGVEINGGDLRGAAAFDYEQDGDIDFVASRKTVFNVFIKNNLSNSNNYLKIKATGPHGDIGGFGTKLWLYENNRLGDPNALLGYKEIITVNGHLSQNSPTQHFGLGLQSSCDVLAQFIDGSFVIQRGVASGQTLSISPSNTTEDIVPETIQMFAGDAQADTVGKDLPDPLEIKVVNKSGRGVSNVAVEFEIVEGDATLFLPSQTSDAIWIEAESGILTGSMRWAYDLTTSGDGLVFLPSFLNPDGKVSMVFNAPAAGVYYGWARILNPLQNGNIDIDLSGELSIDLATSEDWQWVPFSTSLNVKKQYTLFGEFNVVLKANSAGIQIDKLLFVQDVNYTPVGLGETSEDPSITDREGIARRFVQLGTTSGKVSVKAEAQINNAPQSVLFSINSLPSSPADILATGGNEQTGRIEEMLPDPFEVTVVDAFSNPVPNQSVFFQALSGGTVDPTTIVTDTTGKAYANYTPAKTNSLQQVSAWLENSPQLITTFTVFVQGVADRLEYIAGDGQSAIVNEVLPTPVKVQLFTESNSPAINYHVSLQSPIMGAQVSTTPDFENADSTLSVPTDSAGIATAYWKLGTRAGKQNMIIDAGGVKNSPLEFLATAHAEKPIQLLIISGNNQNGVVQQQLAAPFVVRLLDVYSNPIPDYTVNFQSMVGNGSFENQTTKMVKTDSSGDAAASFSLGTMVGENAYGIRAFALVDGDTIPPVPVDFFVNGLPGAAKNAEIYAGNNQQVVVNTSLPKLLTVRVTDEFGNAKPEGTVHFQVLTGNGTFEENTIYETVTDANGLAKAPFVVGSIAGQNSVKAVVLALESAELLFYSKGIPDNPYSLLEISGNNQDGPKNRTLSGPLVVQVQDAYNNGISSHAVKYTVQGELGRFGSSNSVTVATDSLGMAFTFLTLGDELGQANHQVHATAQYNGEQLNNVPVIFFASATRGLPHKLVRTSNKNIIGAAESAYPHPVTVQVVDAENIPVDEHQVNFEIVEGDGHLDNSGQTVSVITDENGQASTVWTLGSAAQNHKLIATSVVNDSSLMNSPMDFFASAIQTNATSLLLSDGDRQTGQAGEKLASPLAVQVTDDLDLPVANHPVKFAVTKGNGNFPSGEFEFLTVTDNLGMAEAEFFLGGKVGNSSQAVSVSSYSATGLKLNNSPVTFSLSATPGVFSADSSSLFVTTPIPSNGIAPATIVVTCRDLFGNPIPGLNVEIIINPELSVLQNSGLTNEDGQFMTTATSQEPGDYTIQARELSSGFLINGEVILSFIQTNAQKAELLNFDNTVYVNSALRDTLAVKITDDNNKGVSNFPVTFYAVSDNVELLNPQPIFTNEQGLAKAQIKANGEVGFVELLAFSPGLENDSLNFSLEIKQASEYKIRVFNDSIRGKVTEKSPIDLMAQITDFEQRPIGSERINIQSQNDEIAFPDSASLFTNPYGSAQTGITFGKKSGMSQLLLTANNGNNNLTVPVVVGPDSPNGLLKVSGDLQSGPANVALPDSLIVAVFDLYNNPIPNQAVRFLNESSHGGHLSDTLVVTDLLGQSRVSFTLGNKTGQYKIKAEVPDTGIPPIYFYVDAEALPAKSMVAISGDSQQGTAGKKLNNPIVVKILDAFGNGVANTQVEFALLPGFGSALPSSSIMSDSSGMCTALWVLGPSTGIQSLFVVNRNLENSPLTFTAQASANTAPIIETVADTFFVNENDFLEINVSATDAQNDSVTILITDLPEGAVYSPDSFSISWSPNFEQSGNYPLTISATDEIGAKSEKIISIVVNNVNRPPVISASGSYPTERFLGNLEKPAEIPFSVIAADADDDPLTYRWYVNNELRASTTSFNFRSDNYSPGFVQVKAVVSDLVDADSLLWTFDVISFVELKYFTGTFESFNGVKLSWETSIEHDNLGFYVLRSPKKEGPYSEISQLIQSQKGVYEFTDALDNGMQAFYYAIEDLQIDGSRTRHDIIKIEPGLPDEYKLYQNYPNPFNGTTTIRFQLPNKQKVRLLIYDVLGRTVRTLVNSELEPGYFSFLWDGKDDTQLPTASGIYQLVFQSPGKSFSKKLLYIK